LDTRSKDDPVEHLYDARIRGAAVIGTAAGRRVHLHGGCWVAPVGDHPPRLMVAFPKEFEGAEIVRSSGAFAVALTAAERPGALGALYEGQPPITDATRHLFLRTPGGSVVPTSSVACFDLSLARALDLGDFLLAVGDVTGAAVLNPDFRNLTVNEIIAQADPRGERESRLPFRGFDYDLSLLAQAPVEAVTPERFEAIYARRPWGLFFVSTALGGRGHHHLGCWIMQTSHEPPRMAVAFKKNWESAQWIRQGAPFAMTLVADDQADILSAVAHFPDDPRRLRGKLAPLGEGLFALRDGVASFVARPTTTLDIGEAILAVADVEGFEWLRPGAKNVTHVEAGAMVGLGWREPEAGFPLSDLT